MCLANCLKFRKFEAGCAYKLVAYKKKVYSQSQVSPSGVLGMFAMPRFFAVIRMEIVAPIRSSRVAFVHVANGTIVVRVGIQTIGAILGHIGTPEKRHYKHAV